MAPRYGAQVVKATILICIFLWLMLNFPNFRSKIDTNNELNVSFVANDNDENESGQLPEDSPTQSNDKNNLKPTATPLPIQREPSQVQSATHPKLMIKFELIECPKEPPNLKGPIELDVEYEPMDAVEKKLSTDIIPGGWFKPKECKPKDRVAIIIPYRDRAKHLPVFLKNLHPLLMKQQIEYGIFVVEQIAGRTFNRAALMNVGFLEASKLHEWDCFIFHDIDLIPMDDRNLYTCPDQPRHMSVAVDTFGFQLPYGAIFGGVSAMTVEQFRKVNGFSNSFWGWGGEDDDMSNRVRHNGYEISRYSADIARYTMLKHQKDEPNPMRWELLSNGEKNFDTDGLNSINYEVRELEKKLLYTWILVEIK